MGLTTERSHERAVTELKSALQAALDGAKVEPPVMGGTAEHRYTFVQYGIVMDIYIELHPGGLEDGVQAAVVTTLNMAIGQAENLSRGRVQVRAQSARGASR